MKFFLDSANLAELRSASAWGIVDGVTTNPSLIATEGVPVEEQVASICGIIDGDVSAEVVSLAAEEMVKEGRRLSQIHKNVIVKVPMTPEGIQAVAVLSREGIRTNVTLCFSAAQALIAAKAGAYIVSPFVGRVDDLGFPGIEMVQDIMTIYANYGFGTKVLAASIRGPLSVIQAAKAGVHIVTLSYKVMEQIFSHPLTDKGLEQFLSDHRKAFDLVKV